MLLTEEERFMAFVSPEPNSGCWLWAGNCNAGGYGQFRPTRGRRMEKAHRASFRIFRGEIPKGLHLDHLCRVRCCVNPGHLEPVTPGENARRGLTGENSRSKTRCPHGHEYSAGNTLSVGGRRQCRTCHRARMRARYQTKRAAGGK